ncbi:peroxiredoxin family protein [Oscillochloris sp. ZM17-4]|uniref:peroxiredoxin family protein n=1 Tax=Oscillochloris sp. ZM17-4 TaxID=2866714 RepID=UPI001C72B312|nr:redoxin domain-containing protein [Oscillochloris sp. ZM17-4]MBX0330850.1 peroxiredoxin family protein [Oscillochloris sp. ZM17-4]
MDQQLSTTLPRLSIGAVVPNFTLAGLDGQPVRRSAYRARKHLALLMLPGVDMLARIYIEGLRDVYSNICAADGEVLVLVADPAARADGLRAAIDVPFPILLDPGGAASQKFLPDGARYGLFILDRYGALHAQWAITAPPLPPVSDVVEWIEVIDNQCSL